MMHLASSDDGEVREGVPYEDFLNLPKTRQGRLLAPHQLKKMRNSSKYSRSESREFPLMSPENLGAAKEERQLLDSLWNTCYNEPSPLREEGLVLPGEDALPPELASKHFEPPLRAWTANMNEDTKPSNEKKQAPLLLGLGPSTQDPPAQK